MEMTAEKKAKELVAKFDKDSWHDATGFKGGSSEQCAFIAANEVWKQLWNLYDNPNASDSAEIIIKEQIDFWADVKRRRSVVLSANVLRILKFI
jgi:hypothetical protein